MKNGGWTLLLKREDGSVDFYRDWKDYKEGFGGPFGEHYLGNEVVHHLTNQGYYSLQVDLKAWDGETRTAHYRHLWLDSEEQGFRLHVLGYSGTAGDGLGKHDGMKFSTRDIDNDLTGQGDGGQLRAPLPGSGVVLQVLRLQPHGAALRRRAVPEKRFDGVAWKPWRGPSYSLKEVVMKIRPITAP
ncbi:angiopoietin-4-like isoform X2 [Pomacea canaliculata]|nr:angiopoietin-4-like isoform X2 [Pomacea canaliculata]